MSVPIVIDAGPSERGWSYYSAFVRCPMLFYWKYVYAQREGLGWSDYTPALARGTLFHVGNAHHYARMWARQNGKDEARVLAPLDAIRIKADQIGDVGREVLGIATEMLHAYWRTYPTETFRIIGVEEPLQIMFGPALYTARLDLSVEEADGKIYIHDYKTTARLESKSPQTYTIHGQFFGQHYLGRATWGDRFGGVIVSHADENGKCYRRRLDPAPFMQRMFPKTIAAHHGLIEGAKRECGTDAEAWASLAHPDEMVCFGKYGKCPAFELCRWGHGG